MISCGRDLMVIVNDTVFICRSPTLAISCHFASHPQRKSIYEASFVRLLDKLCDGLWLKWRGCIFPRVGSLFPWNVPLRFWYQHWWDRLGTTSSAGASFMIASKCGHPGTTLKYRPGQIIGGSGLVGDHCLTNCWKWTHWWLSGWQLVSFYTEGKG